MIPIYDTSTTHTHIDAFLPRVGVKNIGIPGDGEGKKKKNPFESFYREFVVSMSGNF